MEAVSELARRFLKWGAKRALASSGMARLTLYQTVSLVVILHPLAHFSIENSPVTGYICGSVDVFVFAAKGEGSPTCPPFCGAPTGTESERPEVAKG